MPKTSTELTRHALSGPAMGTRWSALFHAGAAFDPAPLQAALQAAVDEVDAQMSPWRPESDLMRLNAAPAEAWVSVPAGVMEVLEFGLAVGRASGGAFDIGMGDAVSAWGFNAAPAEPGRIRAALAADRRPAHDVLELDPEGMRARKHGPLVLDLCGIAKGYGVDRLAQTARAFGRDGALLVIDGELRALGARPDGTPWTIAVERPEHGIRAAHSVLALEDAAVATSGDYRHWVELAGRRLSHTMDPRRGAPLDRPPASVTVVAQSCMAADAWATAMMVLGEKEGADLARRIGLEVLFLAREADGLRATAVGPLFRAAREQVA
jgi:thiamine biosynthesis lipoprotein